MQVCKIFLKNSFCKCNVQLNNSLNKFYYLPNSTITSIVLSKFYVESSSVYTYIHVTLLLLDPHDIHHEGKKMNSKMGLHSWKIEWWRRIIKEKWGKVEEVVEEVGSSIHITYQKSIMHWTKSLQEKEIATQIFK